MTNMLKTLARGAVATVLVSSAAAQSSSRCRITGSGFANSMSQEVGVAVAAEATAYICDPDTTRVESNALATAKEVATATATAIASVFAECTAEGNGSFEVGGRSLAQAEAFAIATSFAEGLLDANVCDFCDAVADFVADSFEEIIISAAAEAEVFLEGQANGGSVEASADVLSEKIVSASTTAFAQVIIAATADIEEGCTGSIVGVVGGFEDTCTVTVGATDASLVSDADTELIVDLIAEACDADEAVIVTADATATATATAMARAIAEITASCEIQGETTACVVSEANINTAAEAVASAFAFAVVDARSTCDPPLCETSTDVLTEAVETILAEATATAVFAQCASMGDTFDTKVLEDEIVTATAKSLSGVYAQASVVGGVCDFSLEAITSVELPPQTSTTNVSPSPSTPEDPAPSPPEDPAPTPPEDPAPTPPEDPAPSPPEDPTPSPPEDPAPSPPEDPEPSPPEDPAPSMPSSPSSDLPKCGGECVSTNRQCDGLTFDAPRACCEERDQCVRRNERFSQCRRDGIAPSSRWDGTIVQCI